MKVGAVVSCFNYLQKQIDDEMEKFVFYSSSFLSAFPLFKCNLYLNFIIDFLNDK